VPAPRALWRASDWDGCPVGRTVLSLSRRRSSPVSIAVSRVTGSAHRHATSEPIDVDAALAWA
jgi:hypothetical protein